MNLYTYASPANFYHLAGRLAPWFAWAAGLLTLWGLYIAFFVAPTDFQQGEAYRIIFIHVPAAWMSMFIYMVMAFWGAIGLAFNTRLSFMMSRALATTGALFTFIALWSAIDDPKRGDRAGALLTLIGAINVPIIYFSVKWWNTLHQGSSINLMKAPTMAATMLQGMLIMAIAAWFYTIAVAFIRVRSIILERERHTEWVNALLEKES